ncbi:MAG: ParB N-terminal domain-containing protein [Planctomycetota bacterium]
MTTTETLPAVGDVIEIDVSELIAHPANDPKRSDVETCSDLLPLIEQYGQREPGKVRRVGDKWELLAGHRRATCCKYLGVKFRAEVAADDDASALRDLILSNIRLDLDPIARAELLQTTIASGVDHDEAAEMFGMSPKNARQQLQLLTLPASLRDLVARNVLPIRYARMFVPFAAAELASDRIAAEITGNEHMQWNWTPASVSNTYLRHTRPCDKKTKFCQSEATGDHPRRFEIDDKLEKRLQIVNVPVGTGKREIPAAQNVVLWDRLQRQALKTIAKSETPAKPTKPAESDDSKKLADKQLAIETDRWFVLLLRCCLAMNRPESTPNVLTESTPVLLAHLGSQAAKWLQTAIGSSAHIVEADGDLPAVDQIKIVQDFGAADFADQLFVTLCYPSSAIANADEMGVLADGVPARFVLSDPQFDPLWQHFAFRCGLDRETCWDMTADEGPARELFVAWLKKHNDRQLRERAKSWGITAKDKLVDAILAAHQSESVLEMPR